MTRPERGCRQGTPPPTGELARRLTDNETARAELHRAAAERLRRKHS